MNIVGLDKAGLATYVSNQLAAFFPDGQQAQSREVIAQYLNEACARLEKCIAAVRLWKPGEFDYLHSSQYCTFLYYLANSIWRGGGDIRTCTKLFCLNKALNGIDSFYEIELPEVFFIGHSVGIVMAKATYGNYFVIYQNSTVGKNHGSAPVIGEGVVMYPQTAIIGASHIGSNSVLAQGTSVINTDTPGNCYVFAGDKGTLSFAPPKRHILSDIFRL